MHPHETTDGSVEQTMLSVLDSIGRRFDAMSTRFFLVIIGAIAALRVGVAGVGPNFLQPLTNSAREFPEPPKAASSWSILSNAVMKGASYPGRLTWWVIGAALLSATLIGVWRVASHLGVWSRPTMILVCLSPAFATSLMLIGHYDIFVIAGSLIVVCSRRPVLIATGATIAVLGNPEQVLVSAICLVIVAYALDRERWRTPSLIFLAAGIVGFLVTQVWLHISGATGSRLQQLLDVSGSGRDSVRNFLSGWPLAIYSWLGPLWIVVLLAFIGMTRRQAILVAISVIGIPAAFTIFTLDVTRVFVSVGLAPLIALINWAYSQKWKASDPSTRLLGLLVVCLIVFPTIVVLPEPTGYLRLPYREGLDFILGKS